MSHDWILDVLADLKAFAVSADLPALAEQLDDTALVALAEIAASQERTRAFDNGQDDTHRGTTGSNRAGN